jgi:hypothetical protein
MKSYTDRYHTEAPKYLTPNLVILTGKTIGTQCPCRNLDHDLDGPFEITEVITDTAVYLNLSTKWKIYKVLYCSLLEAIGQSRFDVNLEKVLDNVDLIEADDEYHIKEVMGILEKRGKVTYLVKWGGFPAKKNGMHENYDSFYSVGAKEELQKYYPKNPESLRDLTVQYTDLIFSHWVFYFGIPRYDV